MDNVKKNGLNHAVRSLFGVRGSVPVHLLGHGQGDLAGTDGHHGAHDVKDVHCLTEPLVAIQRSIRRVLMKDTNKMK